MTIQRPSCMKTFRQGSVSISLCPAAPVLASQSSGVSGYQKPRWRPRGERRRPITES